MKKFLTKVICCFIPSKKLRNKLRAKANSPSKLKVLQARVDKLQATLDATLDCKTLPKATGFSRVLQCLNIEILCEIDRICRKHNLKYWLAFGSLLGAVRHGGHIPWDDDIDLCMMHEDWLRFNELAKTELSEEFAAIVLPGDIGRVCRKDFMPTTEEEMMGFVRWQKQEKLFFGVDIFPVYWLKDDVDESTAGALLISERDKKRKKRRTAPNTIAAWDNIQRELEEATKPIIAEPGSSRVFVSMHSLLPRPAIWRSEDIFPLRDIEFEGIKVLAPKETELQLWQWFGDFWKPVMTHTHIATKQLLREEMLKLMAHGRRLGILK